MPLEPKGRHLTLAQERETVLRIRKDFQELNRLEQVISDKTGTHAEARRIAKRLAATRLGDVEAVRLQIAHELLGVSVPTIRAWAEVGLLERKEGRPARVGLREVLVLEPIVKDLRKRGRDRDLLEAVRQRLEDEALRSERELETALDQMRSGRVRELSLHEPDPPRKRNTAPKGSDRKRQRARA